MKKLLMSAAMAAMFGAMVPAAQAATVAGTFNVSASLTAVCEHTTAVVPTLDFGTYTAFVGPGNATPNVALTFKCTRGLTPPTMALDTSNGTSTAGGTVGGAAATGNGVLAAVGLNYGLSVAGGKTTTGTAPTTAAGNIGSHDVYTFNVTGSMPTLQAGTCLTGTCGPDSHVRTLTVTY